MAPNTRRLRSWMQRDDSRRDRYQDVKPDVRDPSDLHGLHCRDLVWELSLPRPHHLFMGSEERDVTLLRLHARHGDEPPRGRPIRGQRCLSWTSDCGGGTERRGENVCEGP